MAGNSKAFFRSALAVCAVLAAFSSYAASVDRVVVRQLWPWNGLVKVEYKLSAVESPVDISVALSIGGEAVAIDPSAFRGALFAIPYPGIYSFTIDMSKASALNVTRTDSLKVALSPVPASQSSMFPLYKIYDLNTGASEDVTAGEIASGLRGSWFEASTNGPTLVAGVDNPAAITNIVWTGVNSNVAYKTSKLVMRYLPGKTATVNLLNRTETGCLGKINYDYYMGVYELTQKQWELIYGSKAECEWVDDLKPVNKVSYDSIRGADVTNYWSAMVGGNAPHPDSLLGKLRTLTGGVAFDLPTRAMVEYATQANSLWRFANDGKSESGSKNGAWNDDSPFENIPISAATTDSKLPGTYAGNAGSKGPAQVGSFACNKAGLFDTIGNVREWCVDWHAANMKQASYTALKGAANVNLDDPTLILSYQHTDASVKPQMEGSMRYCAGSDYSVSLRNSITPNYFNAGDSGLAPSSADKKTGLRLAIVIGE